MIGPPELYYARGGRMTRRIWVTATALTLSFILGMTGCVSRDAVAGIVALSRSAEDSIVSEGGKETIRSGNGISTHAARDASARYWMRGIVLLIIVLFILWLLYRTFTGWKPMNL
jgi:hypothetical protein